MVNVERMDITLRVVNLFPERHDQAYYACGTSRCYAGFAIDLFGPTKVERVWGQGGSLFEEIKDSYNPAAFGETVYYRAGEDVFASSLSWGSCVSRYNYTRYDDKEYRWLDARTEAMDILDLTDDQADALFNASNTPEDVNNIANGIMKGEEYTCGEDCQCSRCTGDCNCEWCVDDEPDELG